MPTVDDKGVTARRFRKTMVMILAFLMVSSAMLVAVPMGADAAGDKWTSELYAWDPVQMAWVNGNLAGYHEGDLIGFKYVLTHDTGADDLSPQLDSVYDYFNTGKGAYGIDAEVLWGVNTEGWDTQFPAQSEGVRNLFDTVDPIEPTLSNQFFGMSGQTQRNYYMFEMGYFTVPVGTSIYIYFQAHLAETAYYSNVMTTPGQGVPSDNYLGAAYFPGASLQVALSLVFTGTSAQTQSIPVTEAAGSISGMKFHDMNSNYEKDEGEGGLSGWTIKLDGYSFGGFPIHLETITGVGGTYAFTQVPWGIYNISESLVGHDGWTQTFPEGLIHYGLEINGTNLNIPGIDFGNSAPGKIRAEKIIDDDGDTGTLGDQSPGIDWEFELFFEESEGQWVSLGKKLTGADGYTPYWEPLLLGDYKMVETSQAGYTGIVEKFISLTTAIQEITMTFINNPLGSITVSKIIDADGDLETLGDQTNGGAGWEFELFFDNSVTWISQGKKTTDESGSVTWNNLPMGSYKIVETPWMYWHNSADAFTTLEMAGQQRTVMMYNTPPTPAIHIEKSGPTEAEVGELITYTYIVTNVGEVPLSGVYVSDSVSGATTYVSGDTNDNNMMDLTEAWTFTDTWTVAAMPAPLVNIATAHGFYEDTEVTDEDSWSVDLLYADIDLTKTGPESAEIGETITYTLTVENTGDVDLYITSFTDTLVGTITVADRVSGDDGDGILNPGEVWVYEVDYTVLASDPDPLPNTATVYAENHFGEDEVWDEDSWEVDILYAKICVYKYEDLNLDGVYQEGEPAVSGIFIEIFDSTMNLIVSGSTDVEGKFCYDRLWRGTYYVQETVPSDWSTVDIILKEVVIDVRGEEVSVTFLNAENINICGYKLEDVDLDGVGDEGVKGWHIFLVVWDPVSRAYVAGEYDDTYTDENGHYCFENLNPYRWYMVYEEHPSDWTSSGNTYYWFRSGSDFNSGEDITGVNFTNAKNASICGVKWEDHNLNHLIDDSLVWIGWGVDLYKWNGTDYEYVATTYTGTDPLGGYCFENLDPYGTYKVIEHTSIYSTPTISEHEGLEFTASGVNINGMDFLNAENINICGYKLEDVDLDGVGDVGVEGWQIDLYGFKDDATWVSNISDVHLSTVTDADGKFCFENLNPYWIYDVYEEERNGWTPAGSTFVWELMAEGSGENICGVNFLNAQNIDLSACKYEDVNGNGILDESDMPVENWRIDLFVWTDGGWVLLDSKWTGPCGCVVFEDLDPYCDYMISEEGMLDENEGWIPAPGWETEVVFIHGVDFMSGQTYYGKGVVYGILRNTGDVYEIDIIAGTSILVFEMPNPPGADSASPNGLAYDAENGRVYYTDYRLGTNPDTLYFWDGMTQHVAGQIAQGTVACADFSDGMYYYIPSGTDDLRVISFNPDGTILSDVKLADISGNAHSWTFNGDIAVRNGMLYGWGLCAVSGHGYEFFTYDLVTPAFSYIKPTYQNSLQLAFGSNGVLYGHRAGTLGEFYVIDTETAAVTMVTPTPVPPNQYTDTASGVDVNRVTFLNFELVNITAEKIKDITGNGTSEDDTPIEGWEVYLYQKIDEVWVLIDTNYTGADGTHTWTGLGPGEYKVGEKEIIGWLPMTDTEHEFGVVTSGSEYSFTFRNFEVLPCINVTKSVWWDIEEYQSHTQGYWKNHEECWEGINPNDWFAIGGTLAVDTVKFPGGLTYLQVFKTPPKGDASVILAHQYLAAKLNDLKWGAPIVYDGFIEDAEEFLLEHPVGSNPQGEDREYAIMLAEVLTDYNEGNHSGMVVPGAHLIYTVNITNCGNVPLYSVHVYDSLLNETFWLSDYEGYEDGILEVGEWWNFTYEYVVPEDPPQKICNVATAYGQAGPLEWEMWVEDSARVCVDVWYYAATQGYWKNHEEAWVGISPDDMFFDSGMNWMDVFHTPPKGDMIIVLAHQYMASMLNDEMWGAPAKYVDVIEDATDFLAEHQIGDDLTDEEKETAHDLAEMLAEYNEGGVHP